MEEEAIIHNTIRDAASGVRPVDLVEFPELLSS
jgi:hypothetical protein